MTKDTGQESGSPPETIVDKGQEQKVADTPAGSETDQIIAAVQKDAEAKAKKAEESAASKEEPAKKSEKPAPYDQDPKWKKARAAEKRLSKILEKAGLDNVEELEVALQTGRSISDILGDRDAKKLIEDSEYLKKVREYWKEQDALKLEDGEEPEETVERLKQEKRDREKSDAKKVESRELEKAVKKYGSSAEKAIEAAGLKDPDAVEIAKLFLGVDNPFNEVDILDGKAVDKMAKSSATKLKKFLDAHAQAAVDKYAAGKSDITPISSTETPEKETVKKKELPKDATVDQTFAAAKEEVLEILKASVP